MILVLTGTTYAFDALVKAIDEVAVSLGEKVLVQTGTSTYVPKHCEHFRFVPDLERCIEEASLIISHGGAGSIYQALGAGKPVIAVENKHVNGTHQWDLLEKLEADGYLTWCKDLSALGHDIETVRRKRPVVYMPPPCTIHTEIIRFLESEVAEAR
jgi:beta-1,4-N-acetylglucosaminyltransferase